MAGPATKPDPKAAPKRPSSRARSDGSRDVGHGGLRHRDARAGGAVDDAVRGRAAAASRPAPVSRLPTAVPNSEIRMTGFRPMRSDSRPVTGANRSCAIENDATRMPTVVAPPRSARRRAGGPAAGSRTRRGRARPSSRSCRSQAGAACARAAASPSLGARLGAHASSRRSRATDERAADSVLDDLAVGLQLVAERVGRTQSFAARAASRRRRARRLRRAHRPCRRAARARPPRRSPTRERTPPSRGRPS